MRDLIPADFASSQFSNQRITYSRIGLEDELDRYLLGAEQAVRLRQSVLHSFVQFRPTSALQLRGKRGQIYDHIASIVINMRISIGISQRFKLLQCWISETEERENDPSFETQNVQHISYPKTGYQQLQRVRMQEYNGKCTAIQTGSDHDLPRMDFPVCTG